MARPGVGGKRAEVIRHAWREYHAGRIDFATLARVLAGIGGHPPTPGDGCERMER